MKNDLFSTHKLLGPVFCGVFALGNLVALAVLAIVLTGHADIVSGIKLFGIQLFPDGLAKDDSRMLMGCMAFLVIVFAAGVYALFQWLCIIVDLKIINLVRWIFFRNRAS